MIIADDQGWGDYGFMGHPIIETPNLDRLAREGVVFERGYVPVSLCRASLASIITGLYPSQHRITGNDPAVDSQLNPSEKARQREERNQRLIERMKTAATIPRSLSSIGFASFQSGKWWEGSFLNGGFTAGMTTGEVKHNGRHGDLGLKIGREGVQPLFDFIHSSLQTGHPFFIWYAPLLPHEPHQPPERLLKKYLAKVSDPEQAKYDAMCEWFDESCGAILDRLTEMGLKDETLVIFLADNGWIQRTQQNRVEGNWNFGFAPRSKRSPAEGGIRTPMILRWPKKWEPRRDTVTLVESLDIYPTILAACGMEVPENLPGKSLLDCCLGEPLKRNAIFGEIYSHDVPDVEKPENGLLYHWCIRDEWKLIEPTDSPIDEYGQPRNATTSQPQLFHLASDPGETTNIFKQRSDIAHELQALISAESKPSQTEANDQ